MASIVTRGNNISIVYYDINGKQCWEKERTLELAEKRKIEIEKMLSEGKDIKAHDYNVEQYLEYWLETKMIEGLAPRTYESYKCTLEKHVVPIIGDMRIRELQSYDIVNLLSKIRTTRRPTVKGKTEEEMPFLTKTVEYVRKILSSAFNSAVEWELLKESPVKSKVKGTEKKEHNIWTPEILLDVLREIEDVEDQTLRIAMLFSFTCSTRNGETAGLRWDRVNLEDKTILIDKTIQRIKDYTMSYPKVQESIILKFPKKKKNSKSTLVLKTPKNKFSVREVYPIDQLCDELSKMKEITERNKRIIGDEYQDYDLVFCQADGNPLEPRIMLERFKKIQEKLDIDVPNLTFHELGRHSSSTYKLSLSNGDYKTVQGDFGHSNTKILLDTYAQVELSKRKRLSQKIEDDLKSKQSGKGASSSLGEQLDEVNIMNKLQEHPELLAQMLKSFMSVNALLDGR